MKINVNNAGIQMSVGAIKQFPRDPKPQIALSGRSNVGKSSILNALLNRKNLAYVGSTPGKTQTINFYHLEAKRTMEDEFIERQEFYLVDLPGYGFARTGKANRDQWSGFIAKYLSGSDNLSMVCQLIDIRHKPLQSDLECYHWLKSCGLMVQIVLTKSDKLSKNAAASQKALFRRELGLSEDQIMVYSSANHTMRGDLIERIMGAVNNF